jgi:hypothetical protein
MILKVLPVATYNRSEGVPETPLPPSPDPPKVRMLLVVVVVSFRIEDVPASESNEPTVSVLADNFVIPEEEVKTASSPAFGTF